MADPFRWSVVPFHFWSGVFFCFGSIVGSFLNVCVYRMPRGESLIRPPSHCPHCGQRIPWHLNVPLVSWVALRGRCRYCAAPITARYVLIELLTGLLFLGCWLKFGDGSVALALVYCLMMAGLIAATFIDFEHFLIPDAITVGGMGAAFLCSLLVPELHQATAPVTALQRCLGGMAIGGGIIYGVVRLGKLVFGRQKFRLPPGARVYFTEEELVLPDRAIPYGEALYRRSDAIVMQARRVEMVDRCLWDVPVRLTREALFVGDQQYTPEAVPCLEVVTDLVVVPREAMGMGDVKFMAAIGAFLGWGGVLFSLVASAFVGATVGLVLVGLRRLGRSTPIPYGPYLALGAMVYVFAGERLIRWWLGT